MIFLPLNTPQTQSLMINNGLRLHVSLFFMLITELGCIGVAITMLTVGINDSSSGYQAILIICPILALDIFITIAISGNYRSKDLLWVNGIIRPFIMMLSGGCIGYYQSLHLSVPLYFAVGRICIEPILAISTHFLILYMRELHAPAENLTMTPIQVNVLPVSI